MLLTNFKIGGFKVFGEPVELNMIPMTKNIQALSENVISRKSGSITKKCLKSAIIYGGNNTGKSSLLQGLLVMKKLFINGTVSDFPFNIYRNFCYNFDGIIRFEASFLDGCKSLTYGLELVSNSLVGEYLFQEQELLFSRNIEGEQEGSLFNDADFLSRFNDLPSEKLVIPYFLGYTKLSEKYSFFSSVARFFEKIHFVDNRKNEINAKLYSTFINNPERMTILNKLISSTELYMEKREVIPEEEFTKSDLYKSLLENNKLEEIANSDDKKNNIKELIDMIRVTSVYKGKNGESLHKPSFIFDSVGTNKMIVLSMHIINALLDNHILLIDEFDSSLHHKITRILTILMNSEINTNAQFIMTSHDVKLLSPLLFRKDQVNFVNRDNCSVEVVSLNNFKANSSQDIRSNSNYEKMYVEEKIVSLPTTDIYQVIKEIRKYAK